MATRDRISGYLWLLETGWIGVAASDKIGGGKMVWQMYCPSVVFIMLNDTYSCTLGNGTLKLVKKVCQRQHYYVF